MRKLVIVFLFAAQLMAQNPQTHDVNHTEPIFHTNAAWSNGISPGYWPQAHEKPSSSLTLNVGPGTSNCPAGTIVTYAGGTLTMANNTTNYVFLDTGSSCAPGSNTSGFTSSLIPVAVVVTSGGVITTITDDRTMFFPGSSGTSGAAGGDLSGTYPNPTVAKVNAVTYPASPSTHSVPVVTASNTATYKVIPDCQDTGGNHLNFTQSGDTISCGTSGGGSISGLTTGFTPKAAAGNTLVDSPLDWGITHTSQNTITGANQFNFEVAASGTVNSPRVTLGDSISGSHHYWGLTSVASGSPLYWGLDYDTTLMFYVTTVGFVHAAAGIQAVGTLTSGVNLQNVGSSTTVTLDMSLGNTQQVHCTGGAGGFAITLATSNLVAGQTMKFIFVQHAGTACTVTAAGTMHGMGTVSATLNGQSNQIFGVSANGTDLYALSSMQNTTGGTP